MLQHVAGRHGGGCSMACVWETEEGKRREIKRKKIKKIKDIANDMWDLENSGCKVRTVVGVESKTKSP